MAKSINGKTDLTVLLQRLVGRTLTKQDVTYETAQRDAGLFQSTVRLHCLNNEEFVGDPCTTDKAAEHSAAQQAIWAHSAEAAAMPPSKRSQKGKQGAGAALADDGSNPKTSLVNSLQQHCGRTLTKADVVYASSEFAGQFQGTVTLMCLQPPQEFSGEPRATDKEAGHAAAEQALLGQASWHPAGPEPLGSTPLPPVAGKKRKVSEPFAQEQGSNGKSELTVVLQKVCQRPLTKADVVYNTVQVLNAQSEDEPLYQATVKLNCLGGREFTGEPCPLAKAAEHSAADQAIKAYAQQAAAIPASTNKRRKQPGGGAGQTPAALQWAYQQPARAMKTPKVVRPPQAGGAMPLQPRSTGGELLGHFAGGMPFTGRPLKEMGW